MILGLTPDRIRAAEAPLLQAGIPLMQRAAAALAARTAPLLRERAGRLPGSRLVILAGPGDNGGDALFAGARLAERGVAVRALRTADAIHEEGAAALRAAGGRILAAGDDRAPRILAEAHVILDGILGIGGRPELSDALRSLLRAADASPAPLVAVDVPTGVDAATGHADDGAARAALTLCFGAVRAGLLLPGGAERAGRIELADIGLGPVRMGDAAVRRLEDEDVRPLWPVPGPSDHKYSRGVLTVDAGSADFPGAAILACLGAARAGAGMVRYRGPEAVRDMILAARPEIVGTDGRHDAVLVGSGLPPEDPRCRAGVDELSGRGSEGPGIGVLDAGALGAIRAGDRFGPRVVLTPHAGEAARLAEELDISPELTPGRLAAELARASGATVLLKGSVTVIAPGDAPDHLLAQDDATPWLATAGAGDVLAGILGTLLAAGLPGPEAAALAALIHGRSARLASRGGLAPILAADVAAALPAALAAILGGAAEPSAARGGA